MSMAMCRLRPLFSRRRSHGQPGRLPRRHSPTGESMIAAVGAALRRPPGGRKAAQLVMHGLGGPVSLPFGGPIVNGLEGREVGGQRRHTGPLCIKERMPSAMSRMQYTYGRSPLPR